LFRLVVTIVDILIWHSADITTQLLCIGVTVCRPLYKDWLYRVADQFESGGLNGAGGGNASKESPSGAQRARGFFGLRTIGGSEVKGGGDAAVSNRQPETVPSWTIRRDLVFQTDAICNDDAEAAPYGKTPSAQPLRRGA
jgi:hypothetical protein